MKKTAHEVFVEQLHIQLSSNIEHKSNNSSYNSGNFDKDVCREDIMRELEMKFQELFGDLDDD